MRKFATLIAVAVAVVFCAGLSIAAAPDKIVIKEFKNTKAAVTFDHKAHGAKVKECKGCHHKDEAGKEQKCSKCHKAKAEGKSIEAKEAFHKQCKDCHKKEKTGPEKCEGCHPKDKK
jgi:hypothetical protein